jgi:coenzyme PQQ precursor peptide PqqA
LGAVTHQHLDHPTAAVSSIVWPNRLFTAHTSDVHNGCELSRPWHTLDSVMSEPRLFRRRFGVIADTLKSQGHGHRSLGGEMQDTPELEVWTTPDFVEYETPMEVTAYAARMD